MKNRLVLSLVLLFSSLLTARAQITLPAIIGNNMVLQQKSKTPLWGKARPHAIVKVTTSWDHGMVSAPVAADSSWKVLVKTPAAGGPYTITLEEAAVKPGTMASKKLVLSNILIGEVWICSGQSNMEMPVKGFKNQPVLHSNDLLMDADNPQIRLFRLERGLSRKPETDCKATPWEEANALSVKEFSAVGYQYARALQEKLKVPVGMIMPTWGGTVIEAWMDKSSLAAFPGIKVLSPTDTSRLNKNEPTVLFNAMIHPLVGYGIKGVIWYQGEQNRVNPGIYDRLMVAMVNEWRSLWQCGDWPFYYVQIAPYAYNDTLGPAAPLREAQARAYPQISHSGMVVSLDAGEEHSIHPADKTTIGKRLVYWALANTYGWTGLSYASPAYLSMKVVKDAVSISFDNSYNGLTSFGKPITAFEVAGEDKIFYPAKARITGSGITVQSDSVKVPVAVRYAYKNWVTGDLYNTEGLPVGPFRTDSW
jgi:sialate O-acetylesterase